MTTPNVTVQLTSHLDVLHTIEFSFRSNCSQRRSICVFEAHIQISLREFFWGVHIVQGIESSKHFVNSY